MSVPTVADENLDSAKDHIQEAIKNLSSIVIDRVDGYDDYGEANYGVIVSALTDMLRIREELCY